MKTQINNNPKNLEKIKFDSIRLEILYRSLYILKKKFEKYKKDIKSIYLKYYSEKNNSKDLDQGNFPIMKVVNFFPLLQDIFEKIKITIPRINDINSIFNYDISKFDKNSKEHLESIQLMEKSLFANNKKELIKYNNKFYTKKIAPIADYFLRKGNGDDLTEVKCITEYDRKGRIINKFGKLLEDIGIKSSFKLMMKNPKDDFDVNMEKGDILYLEILPIILADFLQENNEFVVIDLDKDDIKFLNDIKTLFDEGLLKKINEDENLNIFRSSKSNKENTIKKNKLNLAPDEQKKLLETQKYKIEKNIKLYQNLLLNKKKKGEPYNHITDIISKMEKEKERIEKEIKITTLKINAIILEEQKVERKKEKKIKSPEEKLQEIFHFYCSQHKAQSPSPTFDQIEYKGNHMNISEFCKFCTEFKIPISLDKLMEIYNKRSSLIDKSEINYNEFIIILEKISIIMNENKMKKYKEKIDKINKKIKGLNVPPDSDEEINNTSDIKILTSKSEQYKKNINNLKSLNNAQIFNEFKMFLEIDKPHKFRDKMKGFLYKYWNDTEKIERYAPLTNDEYQKVKKQVKKFKNMREKSAREKENKNEKLKQELYDKKKEEFILNNQKLVKKIKDREEKKSYILLKNLNPKKKYENRNYFENIIKSNTYEEIANTNINLNKEEKEQIFINDEEENSDEELFQKYDTNKKLECKEQKNDIINNLKISEDNFIKNDFTNNEVNNNSRNITNTNDDLYGMNTSNTNATFEINALKMNLRPKKKDNIYFSSNNIMGIRDITEEMKLKEADKKHEDNNLINNDSNNNHIHNTIEAIIHKKDDKRYQEMYPLTPRFNNNEYMNGPNLMNMYNNNKKNLIGIHKNTNISKDIFAIVNNNIHNNENKIINLEDFNKKNKIGSINNSIDLSNKNRINSYESINKSVQINDFNNTNNNKNNEQIKNSKIPNIIQLPSLNVSNINTFGNNNETAHFKESNTKIVKTVPNNNNVIVLPNINKSKYNIYTREKPKTSSNQNNKIEFFKK